MATVRSRILDEILVRLAAITDVAAVLDAARNLPGDEAEGAIGEAVTGGKYAIEMVAMDDEPNDEQASQDIEAWRFMVAAIVHLPDTLPDNGSGSPRQPYEVAAAIHAEIYKTYTGTENAHSWGGLAIDTRCRGGGGVALGARGTRETVSLLEVLYRHRRGDAEASA